MFADVEVIKKRLEICSGCELKVAAMFMSYCKKCGCPIKSKVLRAGENCPTGRWRAEPWKTKRHMN